MATGEKIVKDGKRNAFWERSLRGQVSNLEKSLAQFNKLMSQGEIMAASVLAVTIKTDAGLLEKDIEKYRVALSISKSIKTFR